MIVETVKRAENGDGIVIRMYEAYKERKTVQIAIPEAQEVVLCDLEENEIEKVRLEGDIATFSVKPFEIVTIKVKGL